MRAATMRMKVKTQRWAVNIFFVVDYNTASSKVLDFNVTEKIVDRAWIKTHCIQLSAVN